MPKGVFSIRLFPGEKEAAQGDQGGTRVAQIVESIGLDGQGTDHGAEYDFEAAQNKVEQYAHSAAENAAAVADSLLILPSVLEKPENTKIIEEALKWQGVNLPLVIERKIKLSELQEQDLQKFKSLGLEVKIEEGE